MLLLNKFSQNKICSLQHNNIYKTSPFLLELSGTEKMQGNIYVWSELGTRWITYHVVDNRGATRRFNKTLPNYAASKINSLIDQGCLVHLNKNFLGEDMQTHQDVIGELSKRLNIKNNLLKKLGLEKISKQ